MSHILFVGDVHAQFEDLYDCTQLMSYVCQIVAKYHPEQVVFLGDLYHNHGIKNLEVERFWLDFFDQLVEADHTNVIALVGNHDRSGNFTLESTAMQVHRNVTVVDEPFKNGGGIVYLPYYHNPEDLVKAAQVHSDCGIAVCHAALSGGHYDNGAPIHSDSFLGKDVASPDDFPQHTIISGHIHAPSKFGKVWYMGSPRWLNMGDANRSRAIHLVEIDDGKIASSKEFSTDKVCRRTWQLTVTPEDACEAEFAQVQPKDRVLVNIRGPSAFCEESKRNLIVKGHRVRIFPTDRGTARVQESEGIPTAWAKHLASYSPKFGTPTHLLSKMFQERMPHV